MRRLVLIIFAMFVLALCRVAPTYAHHLKESAVSTMPVTTSSPQARALFLKGVHDYENLYLERCNDDWRAAVKADPEMAVAWAWLAFNSSKPKEISEARNYANFFAPKGTPGEQLMVSWIVKVQQGDYIGGISAMNDLLEMFPKDKHVFYLAANWLMGENGDEQAQKLLEHALLIDRNFPPALNDLAYVYARHRQFTKAFAAMEMYVDLLPSEPNPEDSYGELRRMAGDFQSSLKHYRAALKIDPDFVSSQLGIGDTYALMGNEQQARAEYAKAIRFAKNEGDRLTYSMQSAMTWVREGSFAEADKEFREIAQTAHDKEQDLQEAQAYRHLAEYQADDTVALKCLSEAEEAISHRPTISNSDKNEELSRILRNRAVRAAHAGNQQVAGESIKQLETMASDSRNRVILSSYNGAEGAILMDQKRFQEAISFLEEDENNPVTMQLLVQAYYQTNQGQKLHEAEARLRGTNVPTMEQAIIVPAARSHHPQI